MWGHKQCLFPSPLAGEGGSRRLPDEGFYPRAICPLSQPLTPLNLWLALVMPSPARGEGVATGTASLHSSLIDWLGESVGHKQCLFPSPLAGEGGSRRLPDEGFYPRAI